MGCLFCVCLNMYAFIYFSIPFLFIINSIYSSFYYLFLKNNRKIHSLFYFIKITIFLVTFILSIWLNFFYIKKIIFNLLKEEIWTYKFVLMLIIRINKHREITIFCIVTMHFIWINFFNKVFIKKYLFWRNITPWNILRYIFVL